MAGPELVPGPNWEGLGIAGALIAALAWVAIKWIEAWKTKKPQDCPPTYSSPDGILVKIVTEALQETSRTNARLTEMIERQGEAMQKISENQDKQAQCVAELQKEFYNLRLELARKEGV
jgi:hypothetical protein